ncbi:MAG TPA: hypothetical protein VH678_07725 [Xanthobacteraceae bacterium]|jgi:hypothetical protein
MVRFPRAECRSCRAALSYFAGSCPACGASSQPNPVTVGIGLVGLVALCAALLIAVQIARHPQALPPVPEQAGEPGSSAAPDGKKADDYDWLIQAMAECDAEAKKKLDKIRFLIVPLAPGGTSLPGWSPQPIGDVGRAGKLVSSEDALVGLRNHALRIYQKPVTFVISDSATGTVYKWRPAVGVAALNASQISVESVKLGFELPDVTDEVEWGPTVNLQKATCYWINPLVLAPARRS